MPRRLTEEERQLRLITERSWQLKVQNILTATGWLWYHAPDNRPGRNGRVQFVRAGFPDLVCIRGSRLLAVELKKETGVVSDAQKEWLDAMARVGAETFVWRPSDLSSVIETLKPNW